MQDVDVVVVGAGLSGLTTAWRLAQRGLSVRVLEASSQVGGRTRNLPVSDGVVTEGGGEWIGARHQRMLALIDELQLVTFPTHTAGRAIYLRHGRRRTYGGTIPPMRPWALADFAQAQLRLERMARTIPVGEPWAASRAVKWDGTTLGHWLDTHCCTEEARHGFTLGLTMIFCEDPHRVSLLHALHQIRTAGGLEFMMNTENGAQESRIVGGSQLPCERIAASLGEAVHLNSPVTAIHHNRADAVQVRSARGDVRCSRVVVAMPPADVARIEVTPRLPVRRTALQRVWHNGTESKIFAVYDRPFWRDCGLNGSAVTDLPAAHYVVDNSPPDGSLGILLTFVGTAGGGGGLTWSDEILDDPVTRRSAVLTDLVTLFGQQAANPAQFIEQSWIAEPWITGCVSTRAPGVLTAYTDAAVRPVGRIHWAGTETAPEFEGYLEGAVRAGERAADEAAAAIEVERSLATA